MWLTPCVQPISWASSSDKPSSDPSDSSLKGQAAAGMESAAAFVSSGFALVILAGLWRPFVLRPLPKQRCDRPRAPRAISAIGPVPIAPM